MDLAEAVKFALSDEAMEIYKKEGKEGLEKAIKKMEEAGMFNKGGAAIKKAIGPQDFRKGGMTLSTVDNRKNK